MKNKIFIGILAALLIISLSDVITAQIGRGAGRGLGRGVIPYQNQYNYGYNGYDYLNLTPEQRTRIQDLELQYDKELTPLYNQYRTKNMELDNLYNQPTYDETAITNKLNELHKIEMEIVRKETELDSKIRNVLTDSQRALYDSYQGNAQYPVPQYPAAPYGSARLGLGPCGMGYGILNGGRGMGRGMGRRMQALGRGMGMGIGRGMGRALPYQGTYYPGNYGYYGTNIYGGARLGRGPCGLGLGRYYNFRGAGWYY